MKERIIGAAVLVLFVVLVVPIFLDGPPNEDEVVSERVLLPGQEGQKTQTVVLDRDRTEPVPVATNATPSPAGEVPQPAPRKTEKTAEVPAEEPVQKKAQPAPQPKVEQPKVEQPKVEQPKATPPATVSSTGMWAVQLGSFSNKDNAEKLAADLRKQAYAAFLSQLTTDKGPLHRVRVGPQKDRESAEAMARRLAKVGHKGQVVPHP